MTASMPARETHVRNWRLVTYVTLVSSGGLALFGWLMASRAGQGPPADPGTLAVVAILLVVGELEPIAIDRRGEREGVNFSGVFACAIFLRWDVAIAVAAQAVASLLQGAVDRVAWWKRLFNVAQYTLALAAAALVFHQFAPHLPDGSLETIELAGALVGSCVFFAVNHTLMGIAIALIERTPIVDTLITDVAFQGSINGIAAALAPLVIVAVDASPWLLALILLPLAAVHRSATLSLRNDYQARHDALTGLANGSNFRQEVGFAVAEAARHRRGVAVVMIDIDDFAELNNTLGHHVGDLLLRQMAERLQAAVGDAGMVARFGGDEFSLLLPDLLSPLEATQRVEAVLQDMRTPFTVEGSDLSVNASLGMSLFPQHGDRADALIQRADIALNVAMKQRAGLEIYSAERDHFSRRRLVMFAELPQAIANRDLTVHYQPKVELRSGRFVGAEALLRWEHPELGLVPPDEFIGVAEHTGQIRQVSEYVLNEAACQVHAWQSLGIDIPVSVNLSALDLRDERLPDKAARLLAVWDIRGRSLVIEVTETALMAEPDRALRVLSGLQELHMRISMDDFGTGYSSLAQLKRLPVDEIKIDRSFITNLESDENDQLIVRSTIDLAHKLGLEVVAEGVETEGEWQLLEEWGCDNGQGFHIGRPGPADELTAHLLRGQELAPVLRLAPVTSAAVSPAPPASSG